MSAELAVDIGGIMFFWKKDDKKKFTELSDMERKELIEKLEKLKEKARNKKIKIVPKREYQ